jgi:hypothetical protein
MKPSKPFARPYRLLAPMARDWARLSFEKRVWGAGEPDDHGPRKLELGGWTATLAFNEWQFGMKQWFTQGTPNPDWAPYPSGGALLAELGPDEFLRHKRGILGAHAVQEPLRGI